MREALREACVNIFNGEALPQVLPPQVSKLVRSRKLVRSKQLAEWKAILSNSVDDEPRSRAWCKRALLRIYANQEREEQLAASVTLRNGIGFTPADAKLLTGIAEQLVGSRRLSPRQWEILYKLLPKYAGQLQRGVR